MVHQVHILHIRANSMNKRIKNTPRKSHRRNPTKPETTKNMCKSSVNKTGKTDKNNRNVLGDLIEIADTDIMELSKHNINTEYIYNGINNESIYNSGYCFVCNSYNDGMIVITSNLQSILSFNCVTNELIICDAPCKISPIESEPKILSFDYIDRPSTYTRIIFI